MRQKSICSLGVHGEYAQQVYVPSLSEQPEMSKMSSVAVGLGSHESLEVKAILSQSAFELTSLYEILVAFTKSEIRPFIG